MEVCMYGWMVDGQTDGWMDVSIDPWTATWMDGVFWKKCSDVRLRNFFDPIYISLHPTLTTIVFNLLPLSVQKNWIMDSLLLLWSALFLDVCWGMFVICTHCHEGSLKLVRANRRMDAACVAIWKKNTHCSSQITVCKFGSLHGKLTCGRRQWWSPQDNYSIHCANKVKIWHATER